MDSGLKILIIDDEDLVRDSLEMLLLRYDHEVTTLPSATLGLELCKQQTFDLILTDLLMPQMDGVEFIKSIRRNNILTPIIALTGGARVGQQNVSEQALESGACITLKKPVTKKDVLDAIEKALSL